MKGGIATINIKTWWNSVRHSDIDKIINVLLLNYEFKANDQFKPKVTFWCSKFKSLFKNNEIPIFFDPKKKKKLTMYQSIYQIMFLYLEYIR